MALQPVRTNRSERFRRAARARIDTVVDYRGAQDKDVMALGTTDAGGFPALSELAGPAACDLHIPIAAAYPLTAVRDAYRALASREAHGRIVLHPQDLT